MPAQAGRQPAASLSKGPTAGWCAGQPTVQPGSEAIFGPASQQPAGPRAGLPARRPARRSPASGQPGSHSEPQRAARHGAIFGRQYHKNSKTPEEKKGRPRKEQKLGEQPGQAAGGPSGQPAAPSQLPCGPVNNSDDSPGRQTADLPAIKLAS